MHKNLKHFALAGAAMALAMTPAMAGAQEVNPETGVPTETGPATSTTPPSYPDTTGTGTDATTGTDTTTGMDTAAPDTTTPPTNPADPAADASVADPTATGNTATTANVMTKEQQQAAIKTWPRETQAYYETLTEERQRMFWALTDTDKVRLSNLPEEQKELAWAQIEAQITSQQG